MCVLDGPEPSDQGDAGRQWFSLSGISDANRALRTADALPRLLRRIEAIIKHQCIAPAAVSLLGFSQGATLVLALAAQGVAFGNGIAVAGRAPARVAPRSPKSPKLFLSHGEADLVVPYLEGQRAMERFKQAVFSVTFFNQKQAAHVFTDSQIDAARRF